MKKAKLKILIGGLLLFLFLNVYTVQSEAATASFTSSISATSVYVGDTITLTIKATNAAGMYNVSRTNSNISVTSGNESEFIENTSTTIKYKATKVGTVSITVSASDMTDLDNSSNKVTGSKTYTVTIKEKSNNSSSSGNSSSSNSSGNTTTTKTPTFKSVNQKVYTTNDCNLRSSWSTSSAATSVKKGTELTLTGTSTETINGYTWYRVTYQGSTKYVASSLVTYNKPKDEDKDKEDDNKDDNKNEKSSNKNLSSLKIDGIDMTPSFSKDTTQYTAHVDGDVDELKINAKAEDSKAKVAIEGNKGLKEGDNIIKVKVTAEDETTRIYFITVTKGEGTEVDTTLKLTQLSIERVNFEDTFKPDTYSYELDLTSYVKKLEITAIPSQADATVDISGNEDFKEGQNVIVILLTSADGSETATYQIKVNVPAEVIEKAAEEEENISFYILIGIAVAVVIIAIIVVVRRHKTSREDDYEEDFSEEEDKVGEIGGRRFANYEDRYQTRDDADKEEEEEVDDSRKSRNSALDDFFNAQDDDDGDRRPRGRHSR
ncbi:MAG: cadherin-like beta sandwich domain-containing protein [Clostridia bacterium]|nr:cadherin-like beta sandwich domain-containing protein [Clostridia bacterium]